MQKVNMKDNNIVYPLYSKLCELWVKKQRDGEDIKSINKEIKVVIQDVFEVIRKNDDNQKVIEFFFLTGEGWLNYHPLKQVKEIVDENPDQASYEMLEEEIRKILDGENIINPDLEMLNPKFDPYIDTSGLNKNLEFIEESIKSETGVDSLEDLSIILENQINKNNKNLEELKEETNQLKEEIKEEEKMQEKENTTTENTEEVNEELKEVTPKSNVWKYVGIGAVVLATVAIATALYIHKNKDVVVIDSEDL